MIPILIDGQLNPRIADEPRLSQNQREHIVKAAKHNPAAMMMGLDEKLRPVIWQRSADDRAFVFALLRNGQAKLPTGPRAGWPHEPWDDPQH